jgi:hypothetical protein
MSFKVYLVRSNVSGNVNKAYSTKELAKKNKGFLEHINGIFVEEEND